MLVSMNERMKERERETERERRGRSEKRERKSQQTRENGWKQKEIPLWSSNAYGSS